MGSNALWLFSKIQYLPILCLFALFALHKSSWPSGLRRSPLTRDRLHLDAITYKSMHCYISFYILGFFFFFLNLRNEVNVSCFRKQILKFSFEPKIEQ